MTDIASSPAIRISRLHVPEESEVHDSIRPLIERNRRQNGYVENWIISMAVNPGTLTRMLAYYDSLFDRRQCQLSMAERELIALVVSAENRCSYCQTHHTKGLAHELGDPIRARRIAAGHDHVPDLSARERALAELPDSEILEAIETIAFFNFTNRIAISVNNVPEDQLFEI
jgi:uncharacterized peroxidase-related enzyme